MSLFGIENLEITLIVFIIALLVEVFIVFLLIRLVRHHRKKKARRELDRKRKEKLRELRAAKAKEEAEKAAEKAEAEARAKAEAEKAKAEAEAEAKVKSEAEARAKAKAEARAKAEAEILKAEEEAKAEAEAKAKAEKEAAEKAAAEAETKKAEAENKTPAKDVEVEPEKKQEETADKPEREVVIDVDDVTMTFRTVNNSTSGIKDYLIQKAKGQIQHRVFTALRNISFQVYKGEVVGIIGTNGSGKSTILKIVSGALRPTSGEVRVNRRKLQLLTLGTGFDGELTGKENVYLNGSIIGYTKEFLDKHYDDIVTFAELQDFMDAKVKTYSSGMVSRLGFAIATAGEAAEILILDEVLSVGDEFFRKKSLARIKEMIHGGSTVLLVSHSLPTIRNNCDRVVWIEKGDLRMVGNPKTVCDAYQKMNDKGPKKEAAKKGKQGKKKK